MDDIYARFNLNPSKIAAWRQLLMLEQPTSPNSYRPPPDVLYNRAIPIFLHWRNQLVKSGWKTVPEDRLPAGLLFVLESPRGDASPLETIRGKIPSSSTESIEDVSTSLQRSQPPARFALPAELSAFLEYREQIQESLRDSVLFKPTLDDRDDLVLAPSGALNDIFHLLQLIVPGMFLLVHDALSFAPSARGGSHVRHRRSMQRKLPRDDHFDTTASPQILLHRTRRALPPAEWIVKHIDVLDGVFGKHLLHQLLNCARDVELTVWKTMHGPDGDPLDSG